VRRRIASVTLIVTSAATKPMPSTSMIGVEEIDAP
jgi:hypothetical protein